MGPDFNKRDYLLPKGCKDLIDVLKTEKNLDRGCPPVTNELLVPEEMTVREVAQLLKQHPFKIIADLMEHGWFANVGHPLDFQTIAKILRKYGYEAKRFG